MERFTEKQKKLLTDQKTVQPVLDAKTEHRLLFMSKPNVIGIGTGLRIRKGQLIDELTVKVYVSRKLPKEFLTEEQLIPSKVVCGGKDVHVDVEEAAIPRAEVFNLRSRPFVGGSSVGADTAFAGSFWTGTGGCAVTLDDRNTYILSNNHVIAGADQLPIGTNILQPSIGDGGAAPGDVIGTLSNAVPLDFGTTTITIFGITITIPNPNQVDCALALVGNAFNASNREIHWLGYPVFRRRIVRPTSFIDRLIMMLRPVHKMGRTTEYTVGRVIDAYWDGFIDYSALFGNPPGTNRAWFVDQLRIVAQTPLWSQGGDSGSLVLDAQTNQPIGLHFAGSGGTIGIVNHIDDVMTALGIPRI